MKIKTNSLIQFYTNDLENVTENEAGKKNKKKLQTSFNTKKYGRITRGQK